MLCSPLLSAVERSSSSSLALSSLSARACSINVCRLLLLSILLKRSFIFFLTGVVAMAVKTTEQSLSEDEPESCLSGSDAE